MVRRAVAGISPGGKGEREIELPGPGLTFPDPAPAAPPPVGVPAADASLWYLAAAAALYAGSLLLLVTFTDAAILERTATDSRTFFWMQLLDDGILAGVALLFGLLRFPGSWTLLGFRRVGLRWSLIGAATALAGTGLAWAISLTIDRWVSVPPHPVEAVLERASTPVDVVLVLVAATVPVAIGEEVFFRGFAYRLLRARLGVLLAVAGSSILFALAHGLDVGEWLPILPLGIVFALLAERSGSLVPPMIGHAAVNALAILAGLAARP